MIKVAMVYPEFRTPTFWSFKEALKIVNKRANMPPYSLLTVAGLLPKEYDVVLYDENIEALDDKQLAAADLVMASAMIVQKDSLQDLITRCNRLEVPIAVGGPLINTGFEDIEGADHYFIGEAENGLALLLSDLKLGKAKRAYGHVVEEEKAQRIRSHFKGNVKLIVGERPSLAHSALPRFDLVDHSKYGSMAVQFSRGCPVGCDFCDIWTQYGRRPRTKSVDRLLAELDATLATGYRGPVFIVDDNFIGNKKIVKQALLPALVDWQRRNDYPFSFFTEATITVADDDSLLGLLHDAGFDMIFCGIETPDEQSLLNANKVLNTDYREHNTAAKLLKQIEKIQRAGIEVSTGLIVGFDGEPERIDEIMGAFIQEAKIPLAMAGLLTALPETDLAKRLEREGRLHGKSVGNNTHGFELNFEPQRPKAEVIETYKRLLNNLYDKNLKRYFERCDGLLDRMQRNPRLPQKGLVEGGAVLIRSLITMLPKRYGWNYLKFLVARIVKDRRSFADAVGLAIKGRHLVHITRMALEVEAIFSYANLVLQHLDKYRASVAVSCEQSKSSIYLKKIYAYRKGAFKELRKRIRRLDRSSRQIATQHYESFVREVGERMAVIEQTLNPQRRRSK